MSQTESSDLIGQRKLRLEKTNQLRDLGIDPFPAKAYRTNTIKEIVNDFANFEGKEVILVGRITAWRGHGKLVFLDLNDQDAKIQLYIKEDTLTVKDIVGGRTLKFEELNLLDMNDFIEAYGEVTKTQRGELSILVKHIRVLTKVIRPLPANLEDKEERFRRRYVDMAVHTEVRERMKRRSLFWQAHRDFFNNREFYEINIPILEHVPGGGDAVPFTTHMNALDKDFFLRISHELPLKRLVGGGFEGVYDIGARFRNEGLSDEHLPEHVAMEFYWAYKDWKDGMKFIQELYQYIIQVVYGDKRIFKIREFEVDFSKEWQQLDFNEVMKERFGIKDIYSITLEEVKELLTKNGIEFDRSVNVARGVDALWKRIRKTIAGPAFLINHPKYLSPLQKPSLTNPNMVERFQPIIAGSELGNGWSELNDPVEQYDRFIEQQKLRDAGDEEAQWLDIDYVEMLEYGMAPTFGYGHSERVFWFLEDVTAREGVPFPQLREEFDNITREIYPEAFEIIDNQHN
jgi:lysyl-tRNA synthetase class 2